MKVKLALAGIGILLIIFVSIGWYLYSKPHTGVSNIDADVRITATDLYNDFQKDETLANKEYLNKVIEVTGNVSHIQNVDGSQIIFLGSAEAKGGISCKLSVETGKTTTVKKSTTVTIKGRCSGYLMDVNLVDCLLK